MKLNKFIYTVLGIASISAAAEAAEIPVGTKHNSFLEYTVQDIRLDGRNLVTDVNIDFSQVNLNRNREAIVTPYWTNGNDSVFFDSFTVAGRSNYYYDLRNGQPTPLMYKGWGKDRGELSKQSLPYTDGKSNNNLSSYNFQLSTPYLPWMEQATFGIEVVEQGCANCGKGLDNYDLATTDFRPRTYEAEFVYVTPVAEAVKSREVSGRAFIDFKVNQTVILPDYRRNAYELSKIIATIDSVKNDKDITVTKLSISGTASPEGPYANNVRLAQGRTQALAEYVRQLYSFPKGFITESYEPVDWKGLAEWLENNNLEYKEAILSIVNGSLPPEQRNNRIKSDFPAQYRFLLDNVYPSLRHSDYAIEFNIRTYTKVDEILEIMQTAPQKLSLAELFVAAQSQEEGSPLYTEAFEIAVRMFPNDPAANLNAGIAAMKRGEYDQAQKYFAKAGDSDEALYSKAVLAALQGDEQNAYMMFLNLEHSSNPQVAEKAKKAAEQLAEKINFKGNFTTLM